MRVTPRVATFPGMWTRIIGLMVAVLAGCGDSGDDGGIGSTDTGEAGSSSGGEATSSGTGSGER
jgi:hypothetical protein